MENKCFCHFNGYEVKDAKARAALYYETPENHGAAGDGVTDDTAAFTAMIAAGKKFFAITKAHRIAGALEFPEDTVLQFVGGKLINEGSVTINGVIDAPLYPIFDGSGAYAINTSKNAVGFPEWFGDSEDMTNSVQKCLDLFTETRLQHKDYWVNTLKIRKSFTKLIGTNVYWSESGQKFGTRVLVRDTNSVAIRVAPDNSFDNESSVNSVCVKDLDIVFVGAPVSGVGNDIYRCSIALQLDNNKFSFYENIRINEFSCGVHFRECQSTQFDNVSVFRSTPGTNPARDTFVGFYLDGSVNNASAYLERCTAYTNKLNYEVCNGFMAMGFTNDLIIDKFECYAMGTGIYFYGGGDIGQNNDIRIINSIFDQMTGSAFQIQNMNKYSTISLDNNYYGPNNDNTNYTFAIDIMNNNGTMSITNTQVIGFTNEYCLGARIENTDCVYMAGNMFVECVGGVSFNNCKNSESRDIFKNNDKTCHEAVKAVGSSFCIFEPATNGAGKFGRCVSLDATSTKNYVNATKCNSDCATVATVEVAGAAVSAVGTHGANVIAGVL